MPCRRFPDQPPVPVSAVFTTDLHVCTVTFDRLLVEGGLDEGNWFLRVAGQARVISSAAATEDRVVLLTLPGSAQPGGDVVSYTPPPFDVAAADGGAAAAGFKNFPVES